MESVSEIARIGLLSMFDEMNDPINNINLCVQSLEKGAYGSMNQRFYDTIRSSTSKMEHSLSELRKTFIAVDGLRVIVHKDEAVY